LKVLFVEDDLHIRDRITATLNAHHYVVDAVSDGEAGLEMAMQWPYDVILLDVMLPKLDGIEVCRQLRSRACQIPILMLTAKGANADVLSGLEAGADDYVMKSCALDQLLARMRALHRRGQVNATPLLRWGDLCLDHVAAQVTVNRSVVSCRPKEYALLELFLRHPQQLLSRSRIIDHLWTCDDAPVEGSVTTLVKDLRQRLKTSGMKTDPIETVYGLGYRLKREPQLVAPPPTMESSAGLATAIAAPSYTAAEPGPQRLKAVLEQIDANFRDSRAERLTILDGIAQSIQTGACTGKHQQLALAHVHKLAGSLGTFGYHQAAAVAETLEATLIQYLQEEAQWAQQFSAILTDLKEALAQASTASTAKDFDAGMRHN